MDRTAFWALIDEVRTAAGDLEQQTGLLTDRLRQLPPEEILAFQRIFDAYHLKAYTWDLWGAAYVILGECCDDSFTDFRCWLIAQGRAAYEAALIEPDSLAGVRALDEDVLGTAEGFGYAAMEAYETVTGEEMPDDLGPELPHADPAGDQWDLDDEDAFAARYPRLAALYGF